MTHLGSVDELVSQTLSDGLDVSEGGLTGACTQQPDGLVDTAQGRHVHSLSPHGTRTTNTGRVFTWAAVDDSGHTHLKWVLKQ
ncbi:hypothetical protein DPMN_147883 [Dreissena polymorpha]|uniref:Uncharacterized protein n=1 Tax=Dreissena polymorpha TaxID=45954 RepID=A0A9D4F8Q6_DREPO|nr:hypothetical protein DPMN_147883 [Dreissena polymorpha]